LKKRKMKSALEPVPVHHAKSPKLLAPSSIQGSPALNCPSRYALPSPCKSEPSTQSAICPCSTDQPAPSQQDHG
jgi:hypothetical protein